MTSKIHCAFSKNKKDTSKLVIEKPVQMPGEVKWWLAKAFWIEDGKKKEFHFTTPKTRCGGTKKSWKNKERTIVKKIFVRQEVCSRDSVENMSHEEQTFHDYLADFEAIIYKALLGFLKDDKLMEKMPGVVESAIKRAKKKGDPNFAIKPILMDGCSVSEETKDKDNKEYIVDPDKPKVGNFDLWGNRGAVKVFTKIYGPGNVLIDPFSIIAQPGLAQGRISFDGIYLGGHGEQSWCASARFRYHEMNYTPIAEAEVPRLLDDNDDVAVTSAPKSFLDEEDEEDSVSLSDDGAEFSPITATVTTPEPDSSDEDDEKAAAKKARAKARAKKRDRS